jgi:hypothetical protein
MYNLLPKNVIRLGTSNTLPAPESTQLSFHTQRDTVSAAETKKPGGTVGAWVGNWVGVCVGAWVGEPVGAWVGISVGI